MKMTLRALSVLLGYPSAELQANIDELEAVFRSEHALARAERKRIEPLLRRFHEQELIDLQSTYSELFDRSRSLSLHLFEHVHGDSRERGQAMIDLGEQYMESGFFLDSSELPDFVPVFLEFASCLPLDEAREMLAQPAHVFAALAERLDKRGSDYAGIFHAVVSLAGARPNAEAVAGVDNNTPAQDAPDVDGEWEEAPISFSAGAAYEMGGPTGVIAKIRASNRPVSKGADV